MKLNRVRRRRRDLQKAAVDQDRLSKLPNDFLINILERVDTLDAIRTCILQENAEPAHHALTDRHSSQLPRFVSKEWCRGRCDRQDAADEVTTAYHSPSEGLSDKTLSLTDLLANAPSISDLHLDFRYEKVWVRPECPKLLAPVLDKVRIVSLENLCEGCDIGWTMFILEAAPSLEELCVTVSGHNCPNNRIFSEKTNVKWEPSVADLKHKNLAKLTIHGFQSDNNFTGYVRRIMEAAVNIKDVSLHDWKVCQSCTDRKLEIKDLSSYPRTDEEMKLLRKDISEGLMMASPSVIHFRPSCYDTLEVKCF